MSQLNGIYLPTFWENIIENSPDAIVAIRKGGEIIIFNRAAEKMLGYSKESVVGRMNISTFYPTGWAKKIMKDLRSLEYGGSDSWKKGNRSSWTKTAGKSRSTYRPPSSMKGRKKSVRWAYSQT